MFFEKQSLGASAVKWLFIVTTVISLVVVFFTLYGNSSNRELILTMVFFFLTMAAVYFLVFALPALTRVSQRGIEVQYRPFIWNWKVFAWHDIKSLKMQAINPIGDFGGWGYRMSFKGKRGIIMGNGSALRIETKEGKVFVLTTNRKTELMRAVSSFWNEDDING